MSRYELLCKLNYENYEHNVYAESINELTDSMLDYFNEFVKYDKYIDIDEDNFKDENGDFNEIAYDDEVEKQLIAFIKSIIEWKGAGEYCLVAASFGEPNIMFVDDLLIHELKNVEFPISFEAELFDNTKEYISNWKKSQGYKYVYFVTFIHHVSVPEYTIEYVVYSNEKIDDVLETVYEERGIFIGEFNQLGTNYFSEEAEDFDIDDLVRYNFAEYKTIYLD